jgi:hypothetical protein
MRIRNKRIQALWNKRGVRERIAAGVLGVSKFTLRKWRRLKKGPVFYKFEDDCVRYPIEALHVFLKQAQHHPNCCCFKKGARRR